MRRGVGQQEQREDHLAIQLRARAPGGRTRGGVRGRFCRHLSRKSKMTRVRATDAPEESAWELCHVPIQAFTNPLQARRGAKHFKDLRNQESNTTKEAMVRFWWARENGALTFVNCTSISQDTMEDSLSRETLSRSLGSHDVVKPAGGMYHGSSWRKQTTRVNAISGTKAGQSSFIHKRVLH